MIYDLIAPFYDRVNSDINYSQWADFIEKIIKNVYKNEAELVLDLGSGTGKMTIELARRGYDMTAVDYSSQMLNVARDSAEEAGLSDRILFLCQDMRELDLYGTVDLVTCTLDSLNYLESTKELTHVFSLVNNFLEEGGIFVFDVNTERKFSEVYGDNAYVFEDEGVYCGWQNYYNEKSGKCRFALSIFRECEDGRYERLDEYHTEKCHKEKIIDRELKKCGFEILGKYSDFKDTPACDDDMRHFYVVRNILPRKRFEGN